MFIFRGTSMLDYRVILAGAIPAALIALAADFGMSTLEKHFMRERQS
jgi:osmoprotectant transport system permease protein